MHVPAVEPGELRPEQVEAGLSDLHPLGGQLQLLRQAGRAPKLRGNLQQASYFCIHLQ